MADKCPECGAPLRSDGFCDLYCHKIPKDPLPRFAYADDGVRIGTGQRPLHPVKRIKLYQFMQEWREQSISEQEIRDEILATLRGRNDVDIEHMVELVLELLESTEEVTCLEIEPTAWDRGPEKSAGVFLRVGPGQWFAAGNLTLKSVSLLVSLLLATHGLPHGILAVKDSVKAVKLSKALTRALVTLPEGSVEWEVFESLNLSLSIIPLMSARTTRRRSVSGLRQLRILPRRSIVTKSRYIGPLKDFKAETWSNMIYVVKCGASVFNTTTNAAPGGWIALTRHNHGYRPFKTVVEIGERRAGKGATNSAVDRAAVRDYATVPASGMLHIGHRDTPGKSRCGN
ncbi:hypothetical protein IV500_05350 [Paeniglutamicibacter antarcticus]|uniref:Uncharacterized protein n=1 Tax=Arthrobacter terrae TaxID=2935737 RepID=A0A931CMY1_9MICC|nr:hypothetical protein [Arthrobacter terrae]MBG0738846.1 hypothetical protein [Arthrobacter terrae]